MIAGIGIDIVEVADVERRLKREAFLNIFSDAERAHADSLPLQRAEMLAGRFAAKEAFGKALGTGLRVGWDLRNIAIVNDAAGRPQIELGKSMKDLVPPGAQIHVSISHVKTHAVAVVVIEQ
jgi:holo-[acyl-carrier protein] synthase